MVELSFDEAICLFRLLKNRGVELETSLVPLVTRIEQALYEIMSIEEIEKVLEEKKEDKPGEG